MKCTRLFLTLGMVAFTLVSVSRRATAESAPTAVAQMTENVAMAAQKFLASLEEGQRAKVVFAFEHEEQRKRWSNLPDGIFQRAGCAWAS